MKNNFKLYLKAILPITLVIIVLTVLILSEIRKLNLTNLLNAMFVEGSIGMLLSAIFSYVRPVRIFRINFSFFTYFQRDEEQSLSIGRALMFFLISITLFISLFLIHLLAKTVSW
jgi:hypothetical protein